MQCGVERRARRALVEALRRPNAVAVVVVEDLRDVNVHQRASVNCAIMSLQLYAESIFLGLLPRNTTLQKAALHRL
jgi:hypothetical protein